MSEVRLLAEHDRAAFIKRILEIKSKAGCPGWAREVNEESLFDYLMNNEAVVLMETYLLFLDKGSPWYAQHYEVLSEKLIIRLYPKGEAEFSDLIDFMKYAAKVNNCRYIAVGTALTANKHSLASMYQKHGFKLEGFELSLEI